MTEPTDPLERRLHDGLHAEEDWAPDVGAARTRFAGLHKRRVTARRTGAVAAAGLAVAALALLPTVFDGLGDDGAQDLSPLTSTAPSADPTPTPNSCTWREIRGPDGVEIEKRCVATGTGVGATPAQPEPTSSRKPLPVVTANPAPSPEPQPSKPAPPTPEPTGPGARIVEVTEADSGRTISLRVGDFLVVSLHGSAGFPWTPPESSDDTVLRRAGHTTSDGGDTQVGKFVAERTGNATVSASQDPTCRNSTPPCAAPSRAFGITVRIT